MLAGRDPRMQLVADPLQLRQFGVAARPVTDRLAEITDVAEHLEGPDDVADVVGMHAARDQRPACGGRIGLALVERQTGRAQVARAFHGGQILLVGAFGAGFGVQVQIESRVFLALRPDAFPANVGPYRRHDVDTENGERNEDKNDDQKRPGDPYELRILALRRHVHRYVPSPDPMLG